MTEPCFGKNYMTVYRKRASNVGYHIRAGGHSIEAFDWLRFLEFAEYHLNN